jgi:hypothetical protein
VSSSDSNAGSRWHQHYEEAAKRRRARGWHRHADSEQPGYERDAARKRGLRLKVYVGVGALFVVATLIAMFLPR